jgi:uncharacterized protein (DUF58 family)
MLPAEIAQSVRRLQFVTGRQVADVMAGAYLSVFKGRGMEFDEVRPYVPGDDVRSIDWNVTARTGEPHVKRYVEERELTVMLLVDVSASLDFGSGRRSKLEAAAELAALLALSAVSNDDKVGLLLFHGGADLYIPPRKGQKHALRVIREVLARGQEPPSGPTTRWRLADLPRTVRQWFRKLQDQTRAPARRETSIAAALEFCRKVLPRKTVLFLVSDFLDEGYLPVLRHANRRHDVVSVLITDPREQAMPPAGLVTLEDAETGVTRLVDTRSAAFRGEVERGAKARLEKLDTDLRSSGVDLVVVDAAGSVIDPVLRFFRQRQRRLSR